MLSDGEELDKNHGNRISIEPVDLVLIILGIFLNQSFYAKIEILGLENILQ